MRVTCISILFIVLSANIYSQTNQAFTFEFTDAALAPQYHRSYTIHVTNTEVKLMVTNYVDTLLNEKYPTNQKAFRNFQKKLLACGITANKENDGESGSCTGGTGDAFVLPFSGGRNVEGVVYDCGGRMYGNITGKIADAVKVFQSMVPKFADKLASTRK